MSHHDEDYGTVDLLRECRKAILEAQWAIRMLTDSVTPQALDLKQLKANQDELLARLDALLSPEEKR